MSIKLKPGSIYKCNCGGIWRVANQNRNKYFHCELINTWMPDCTVRRGSTYENHIGIGAELTFDNHGIIASGGVPIIQFISEVKP